MPAGWEDFSWNPVWAFAILKNAYLVSFDLHLSRSSYAGQIRERPIIRTDLQIRTTFGLLFGFVLTHP